ncbi:unnamed protein product [Linum tenue]|uniref:Uncharacterized protein n=1 Tax=Linum tenue TaxID=586396 RepID=A0AAV0LNC0_9ROSI|nr:unnamed protein product [Linum tenue]
MVVAAWGLLPTIWEYVLSLQLSSVELFWGSKRLGMRDTAKCSFN